MKRLAAILFVIFALAGLSGCAMSRQETIRAASRFLELFRASHPHTYDPALEERIRRDYSSLHFEIEDDLKQHIALTEDVLREHTMPMD